LGTIRHLVMIESVGMMYIGSRQTLCHFTQGLECHRFWYPREALEPVSCRY
jgi:hypothetical protein